MEVRGTIRTLRERVPSYHMEHGKVPLLSKWKGIHLGNRSKATSFHLQEAHGENFPKDPEVSSEKLSISTFQCSLQERSGNSTN